ncbi:competence pheromone ComX [Bacillus sp. FJAT-22090]|uniref:competence pheromone ComX n=1 Tax=Bacillus sp. FJAT-22090 TaxID=1581038 RepID=UPI00119D735E|nr:competence pheromone ComX [Bacillus sp. FJAT-22090]
MLKIIQYLNINPEVIELLKGKKVSLVGIHEDELEAILEVYSNEIASPEVFWD